MPFMSSLRTRLISGWRPAANVFYHENTKGMFVDGCANLTSGFLFRVSYLRVFVIDFE
jgi:hypothetical protein